MALSLFSVTMSHYYGVLTIACIGLAEMFRVIKSRKLDLPILVMIGFGSSAVVVLSPIIQAVSQQQYHTHPSWPGVFHVYSNLLTVQATPLVPLLLLPALLLVLDRQTTDERGSDISSYEAPPQHETVALLLFCASPLLMLPIALVAKSGFEARFCIPAIAAFIALGAVTLACRSRFPHVTGVALLLPLLGWFCLQQYFVLRTGFDRLTAAKPVEADLSWDSSVHDPSGSLPIADPYGARTLFYSYYWPQEQSVRLSLVTPIPIQDMGSYLSILIPMTTTLDVQPYYEYTGRHRRFLLFGDKGGWFLNRLHQDKATLVLLGHAGEHPIFEVTMPRTAESQEDGS